MNCAIWHLQGLELQVNVAAREQEQEPGGRTTHHLILIPPSGFESA
jgi:hypothetical protein